MMREAIKAVSRAAGGNDDHEDLRGVAIYGGEGPQHLLSELNFAATNRYIVAAYGPNLSVEDGITDWGGGTTSRCSCHVSEGIYRSCP